ncbi:MAG: phosphoglycerate kinase [Armatimonadetes bacterium]|nr:phosphoglycerate kinase [Armatimonadota bacterium]MDW8121827.1 phosphoglycerate kinase [Armatimonadota bacterium]
MRLRSVKHADIAGKKVLLRVDFNVPVEDGRVLDDWRLRATMPTLQFLAERQARSLLISHLGRPKGKRDEKYSLRPVAHRLAELLGAQVAFANDCIGPTARQAADGLSPGSFLLLENLRFYPGEEANDPEFAKQLAELADVYVNDAFGAAHRAHASVHAITQFHKPYAGLLMEKEVTFLSRLLSDPERPFLAVLGGAKVSDKVRLLHNLLERVDALLIGGAMAFTFLKAQGKPTGKSLVEEDRVADAEKILKNAAENGISVLLPSDVVVSPDDTGSSPIAVVPVDKIPEDQAGWDIGPETARQFAEKIRQAKTIFWNGPMGRFERGPFKEGTKSICLALAECAGTTVVGGGETAAAAFEFGIADQVSHVSTGGGAALEFLEGRILPGIQPLLE